MRRIFTKDRALTIILAIAMIILSVFSLFVGVLDITPATLLDGSGDSQEWRVFMISRLPRLLAILCTGIGMSVAGLIMQKLTQNKFVSPTTGATISSAEFGILIAMLFIPVSTLVDKTIFAFVAAILGTWAFVFFVQRIKFKDVILVPLVGIMFGNIIGGVTNYLAYKYEMLQALSSWLVGDFSLIIQGRYEIVFLVVPLVIIAFIFANHFNIVSLGKDFSKNLGVNYNFVLFGGLTIAAVITASVVVTVGSIPYLGLIIPNIVAMFKGDKIRNTLIDTALFGAVFVLACDIIGRVVIYPYELPINLIVGVIGSAIFIVMMFAQLSDRRKAKKTGKKDAQIDNTPDDGATGPTPISAPAAGTLPINMIGEMQTGGSTGMSKSSVVSMASTETPMSGSAKSNNAAIFSVATVDIKAGDKR